MITFVGQTPVKHLSSFRDRMKVDPVSQIVMIAFFDRQLSRVTQVQTDLLEWRAAQTKADAKTLIHIHGISFIFFALFFTDNKQIIVASRSLSRSLTLCPPLNLSSISLFSRCLV